jgi:hypothetical protein
MALKDQKDVFIAWINGETIQSKLWNNNWYDCIRFTDVEDFSVFQNKGTYRIKPKELVTTTLITYGCTSSNTGFHTTNTRSQIPNLKLTWSSDGETLLKAEVI